MILPVNPVLLSNWRSYLSRDFGPRPRVPYVKQAGWRNLTMLDDGSNVIRLVHRREITGKSVEWMTANAIWDAAFVSKTHYKSHRDLDWDYLLVYERDNCIMAVCMLEIRCIDEGIRGLYKPFGIDRALWPGSYTPTVFVSGLALADLSLKGQGIGRQCMQAVCAFSKKLLVERATSPWENAFGAETSKIPVTLTIDKADGDAYGFYQAIGFHISGDDDKKAYWYSSWTSASSYWIPDTWRDTHMVKWIGV